MHVKHLALVLLMALVVIAGSISYATSAISSSSGLWTPTGSLSTGRAGVYTGILLHSGKVLLAGGMSNSGILGTSEVYDPIAGTWQLTGNLHVPRFSYAAALLPDGRVMVAGGCVATLSDGNCASATNSVELYDPDTGMWQIAAALNSTHLLPTLTVLHTGHILMTGGCLANNDPCTALSSSELYDPTTNKWTVTGSMITARANYTATLLTDGRVLVVGGLTGGVPSFSTFSSAELYDPSTGTWEPTGSMHTSRWNQTATLLKDGHVLEVGGANGQGEALNTAELYDPQKGTWSETGAMATARFTHSATLLKDGRVLVVGGSTSGHSATASAELYNPSTADWTQAPNYPTALSQQAETLLQDSDVLVAGGVGASSGALATSELYKGATSTPCTSTSATGGSGVGCGTPTFAGRYVAMGDSYAAGQGSDAYDSLPNDWPGSCNRSSQDAWGPLLARYLGVYGNPNRFLFVACGGAVISDIDKTIWPSEPSNNNTNEHEGQQILALSTNKNDALVTLSIGGNDIGFAPILTSCLQSTIGSVFNFNQISTYDCRSLNSRIQGKIAALRGHISRLIQKIHSLEPKARIMVMGYPHAFSTNYGPPDCYALNPDSKKWMNEKAQQLDAMIRSEVAASGVAQAEYIDAYNAFDGHEACDADAWIHAVQGDISSPGTYFVSGDSFHPKPAGHCALYEYALAAYLHREVDVSPCHS